MSKYAPSTVEAIRLLRSKGKTYSEIRKDLKTQIPKSTLSNLCRGVILPREYFNKINKLNTINRNKGRLIALEINKIKRQEFLRNLDDINFPIATSIRDQKVAKIALAMLCLGEASKYSSKSGSFSLGSSDPRIIIIFLKLLKKCFDFKLEKVRCTVQCRADQNTEELEEFWYDIVKIPKNLFYKTRIDPRTIGKPTKKKNYKGVLRVDYLDTKVQLELESLSDLIYNEVLTEGPEV
ncbi:hypothetical protein M1349_02705 [Patescibacteria group bacterium]|nr:hypothetical protein [Patescibacteria group bacterium]